MGLYVVNAIPTLTQCFPSVASVVELTLVNAAFALNIHCILANLTRLLVRHAGKHYGVLCLWPGSGKACVMNASSG